MAGKFEGLDGLRGLLAAVVLCAHGFTVLVRPYSAVYHDARSDFFATSSRYAVWAFFVLSGFVIAHSLMLNRERHGHIDLRSFVLARCRRILPPLLATIALVAAQAMILQSLDKAALPPGTVAERSAYVVDYRSQFIALGTLCLRGTLDGGLNGPLWSLAYEIQLYVLMGLGAAALYARGPTRVLAAVASVVYACLLAPRFSAMQGLGFAAFGAGVAARLFESRASASARGLAALSAATLVLAGLLLSLAGVSHLNDRWSGFASQFVFALGFALCVLAVARRGAGARFAWTGAFSYSVYISHFPILLAVFFLWHPLAHPWLAYGLAVPSALAIGALLGACTERLAHRARAVSTMRVPRGRPDGGVNPGVGLREP